jgi:2-phospho-L-lactate/phosphoenolpyruvate guanylyltransferase
MRTAAILPVKRFPLAKQRLGESVADSLRADLTRAMVGDVLSALRDCPSIDATIVVTCESSVASAARYVGAIVVEDSAPLTGTGESGQSAAASLGLARALQEGFERALCVPGDCPMLDPDELTALLASRASSADVADLTAEPPAGAAIASASSASAPAASEVVIVPDRHGRGTNGLVLAPPDAISPSFGPDSCARHEQLAGDAGARWRIERPASLLLDIDTGEDLAVLRERLAGERVRAPRTRAVLGRTVAGAGTASQAGTAAGQGSQAA